MPNVNNFKQEWTANKLREILVRVINGNLLKSDLAFIAQVTGRENIPESKFALHFEEDILSDEVRVILLDEFQKIIINGINQGANHLSNQARQVNRALTRTKADLKTHFEYLLSPNTYGGQVPYVENTITGLLPEMNASPECKMNYFANLFYKRDIGEKGIRIKEIYFYLPDDHTISYTISMDLSKSPKEEMERAIERMFWPGDDELELYTPCVVFQECHFSEGRRVTFTPSPLRMDEVKARLLFVPARDFYDGKISPEVILANFPELFSEEEK